MKKLFIIILAMVTTIACCNDGKYRETRGNDTVVGVSDEDKEMNAIIDAARNTVGDFIKVLENPKPNQTDFSVKYPFPTDKGSPVEIEHIWLMNIEENKGIYSGLVANDPFHIKEMEFGDKVEFDIKKISDWKYVEDSYLVGGESIVYFYKQMTPDEKKAFPEQTGFKIRE
ncbi:MAG: DUF2314 domain-containing protein [Spirochaetaceae bacterium]|nr:MAG: DUF2314 domain-containing protein [Spirochaetaceae bacterium]